MNLRIVSLNLGGYKDWMKREKAIIAYIDETEPDIVVLQEVHFDKQESAKNQASKLNEQLSKSYEFENISISRFYVPQSGGAYREGLAILSKYQISRSEVLVLMKRPEDKHTRIIQNVDVKLSNSTVSLTNVHFSNNMYSLEQLGELIDILESRDSRSIIVGDFNIFDLSKQKSIFKNNYYVSTDFADYISFLQENVTIDYMLLPKAYGYKSISTKPGLSDHSALNFSLEV